MKKLITYLAIQLMVNTVIVAMEKTTVISSTENKKISFQKQELPLATRIKLCQFQQKTPFSKATKLIVHDNGNFVKRGSLHNIQMLDLKYISDQPNWVYTPIYRKKVDGTIKGALIVGTSDKTIIRTLLLSAMEEGRAFDEMQLILSKI